LASDWNSSKPNGLTTACTALWAHQATLHPWSLSPYSSWPRGAWIPPLR
jgi:hypothetical protein